MSLRRSSSSSFLIPALLTFVSACSASSPLTGTLRSESDVTRGVVPGLEQRVTLTPAELVTGQNVQIHSVITNRSSQPIELQSRICGLDLGGDIELTWPPGIGVCGGHSMGGSIAPGESRESSALRRVDSGLGSYTLRVKHALQPERWVEMRVVVRGR